MTEAEIDVLARGIVAEVRKRGPFLSLADFVNRRVEDDKRHARAGAVQSAIDSSGVGLNRAFGTVNDATAKRFAFPETESGTVSFGIPGQIKQADILTPIAPVLSARSDSFIIRACGESRSMPGARRWPGAGVRRCSSATGISSTRAPAKSTSALSMNSWKRKPLPANLPKKNPG